MDVENRVIVNKNILGNKFIVHSSFSNGNVRSSSMVEYPTSTEVAKAICTELTSRKILEVDFVYTSPVSQDESPLSPEEYKNIGSLLTSSLPQVKIHMQKDL